MIGTHSERDCPDAEALAAWSEGRGGGGPQRTAMERHIGTCRTCADIVAAALPADEQTLTARVTVPGGAGAARSRAGTLRWAIAATLVVATAALAYAAVGALVDRARVEVATRATRALGEPVAIGSMHLGVAHDLSSLELRLGDVRIGNGDATTAESIAVSVPLASLAARNPVISRLRLVGAVLHVAADTPPGRGGLRLGGANAVAAAMMTTPVELVESTVHVTPAAGSPLRFDHVAGTTTPADGRLQVDLSASLAGGTVSADGDLALDETTPISITIAGRKLAVAALPFAAGRLTGSGDLAVRVTGTARAPMIAGRLLVGGGRIVGWNPIRDLLPGGNATGALAAVSPQLVGDDLAFDELRAVFLSEPQGWRLPRVYLTSAGVAAGATLGVDAERRLDGNGSVRLPAEIAGALIAAIPPLAAARADDRTVTIPIAIGGSADAPHATLALGQGAPPSAPAESPTDQPVAAPPLPDQPVAALPTPQQPVVPPPSAP